MKLRVVQLANLRWVCEAHRWHWVRWYWRAVYFDEQATKTSTRYGGCEQTIMFTAPGTPLYPVMTYATKEEALKVFDDVRAYYGYLSS